MTDQWRDIGSAPRDGTRILICYDGVIDIYNWNGHGWGNNKLTLHYAFLDKIQGWLPLPAPPQPKEPTE